MTENKRKTAKKAGKAWSFPRRTLEEAIRIARAIEDKFAGKSTDVSSIVKSVGFNNDTDWRFREILIAAEQYGIVSRTDKKVALTPIGQKIVAPGNPEERQAALLQAFESVENFKKVSDHYQGKKIPEDEYFINTLVKEFRIDRERVDTFRNIFRQNLDYLNAFSVKKMKQSPEGATPVPQKDVELPSSTTSASKTDTRQYLDTCFVLMPFGGWHDAYYSDLYKNAIQNAGFDPVRADGIFTTGTVIEQIWDQIRKAKVLLAELTGKNPNVFYELGLAHSIGKPVILITGSLEDVPFDLRHVRIIIYDIHDPKWGDKLASSITAHLQSAKDDPEKSIPRMFRQEPAEEEEQENE